VRRSLASLDLTVFVLRVFTVGELGRKFESTCGATLGPARRAAFAADNWRPCAGNTRGLGGGGAAGMNLRRDARKSATDFPWNRQNSMSTPRDRGVGSLGRSPRRNSAPSSSTSPSAVVANTFHRRTLRLPGPGFLFFSAKEWVWKSNPASDRSVSCDPHRPFGSPKTAAVRPRPAPCPRGVDRGRAGDILKKPRSRKLLANWKVGIATRLMEEGWGFFPSECANGPGRHVLEWASAGRRPDSRAMFRACAHLSTMPTTARRHSWVRFSLMPRICLMTKGTG